MLFFDRVAALEREHASFAIATVVARRSPVSSHLGDRALIFADGHMEGFVGGSCSRDIVRRHALEAIGSRQPLLLQIRPDGYAAAHDAAADTDGRTNTDRVVIPMSCSSEGAVDVYIEPRVPLRRLVVVGFTPVAEALARIAVSLDYDVARVVVDNELRDMGGCAAHAGDEPARDAAPWDDAHPVDAASGVRIVELKGLRAFLTALDERARRGLVAIVASQGHYDELALEALLAFPIAFTGLLASRRRAATVAGVLAQQGLPADRLATIHNPVGLDIGARSPGEVAVSILAQIIAHSRSTPAGPANAGWSTAAAGDAPQAAPADGGTAIDPICGMDVETAHALYRSEHGGRTYYFCGAHCRASFAADPDRALLAFETP